MMRMNDMTDLDIVKGKLNEFDKKKIEQESDKKGDEQVKEKGKRGPKGPRKKVEDFNNLTEVFSKTIITLTNSVFVRLKWEPLDQNESVLLTEGIVQVGNKYLPKWAKKFGEELNLIFVISLIVFSRYDALQFLTLFGINNNVEEKNTHFKTPSDSSVHLTT
ncbi:MAG: hypothetical protein JSW62_04745 [Thermoplasmatales archaeon]|nr:MAG: hypothetical protein JSW62_04745 [Thermoplasmatales archaeon]